MKLKDSNTFYKANTDVSTQLTGNETAVLFHPDTNQELFLNASGLSIWKCLDGSFSVTEITDGIQQHFAESAPYDQILNDANHFLTDLTKQGFVNVFNSRLTPLKELKNYPDINDSPKSFDISLTGRCNLRCRYCFFDDEMKSFQDLPAAQWISFFEELGRLAVREVCLSGGEVFTRPDLWDLIDSVIQNRMRYSILTNGTLINEKILALFEKDKRRQRLNNIQISIDGSCPEIHDKSRGKGSFERAVKGLRLLKEARLPLTSRVTINQYNVHDIENIARLLLDDIGLQSFGTNDAMPMGAGCYNQKSIVLKPDQQLKAMKTLDILAKRYNGRIIATAGPLAKWRNYRDMEYAKATGEKTTKWEMGRLTACGGVFNKLAIRHDGVINPCNMLSKLELGKMGIDPVQEIWRNHTTLLALRQRREIPMDQVPGCENCKWATYCNGSCPGLAYEMTGDFNLANPHDCYRSFLMETGLNSILDTNDP